MGSRLEAGTPTSRGNITIGGFGEATLKVENEGVVQTNGTLSIGAFPGGNGTAFPGGDGEVIVNTGLISATSLEVGDDSGAGTLTVTGTPSSVGAVDITNTSFGDHATIGSAGKVTIGDDGAFQVHGELEVNGELRVPVGTRPGGVGIGLGAIPRGFVSVFPGGTLSGTGTIFGRLVLAGGTSNFQGRLRPARSPGTFSQEPNSLIVIEIAGTALGEFDVLDIAGDLSLEFIDGFAPRQGDRFDFLPVTGTFTGGFANVGL